MNLTRRRLRAVIGIVAGAVLCACTPEVYVAFPGTAPMPAQRPGTPKKIVVFFDGTNNKPKDSTNVYKLYQLVMANAGDSISTAYLSGVGTDATIFLGFGLGIGIGHDVRRAYRYLGETYSQARGDKIFLFGFSRGAYAARILTGFLKAAGVQDLTAMSGPQRSVYVGQLYDAYKGRKSPEERREAVSHVVGRSTEPARVEFLGLWETVEALALPAYRVVIDRANPRHDDQMCNVRRAAQALALDDDRYRIFTPLPLTRRHLTVACPEVSLDTIVNEVWFSGAHSDVGGGYDDTLIHGVPLNWMLRQIEPYGLVPSGYRFPQDVMGTTHDPEAGIIGMIYRQGNRNIREYFESPNNVSWKYKIHDAALQRLRFRSPAAFESRWFADPAFRVCFRDNQTGGVDLIESDMCPFRRAGNERLPTPEGR